MARTRSLKPGFFRNETLAELPFETRLLFAGLWVIANRRGQVEDRPKKIHADLFPYDHALDVDQMLEQLDQKGFIYRYILNGSSYLQIVNFLIHQRPHPDEPDNDIPRFPINLTDSKACREFSRLSREKVRQSREISRHGDSPFFSPSDSPSLSPSLTLALTDNAQPPNGGGEHTEIPLILEPSRTVDPLERRQAEWFAGFWALYWRKVGKKPAWEAFRKKIHTEATYLKVRAAVEKQKPAMLARDPERRPHASTWLNQERWNDEDDPPVTTAPTIDTTEIERELEAEGWHERQ